MTAPSFVDLARSYLCTQCEAIGESANRCPRCQSSALIAITRVIPRHRDSIRLICNSEIAQTCEIPVIDRIAMPMEKAA